MLPGLPHFSRGDIVLVLFPYSAAEQYKVRPALVLVPIPYFGGTDYILCAITTQHPQDPYLIELLPQDVIGNLTETCYIKPTNTFSADEYFIRRKVARLKATKFDEIVAILTRVLNQQDA